MILKEHTQTSNTTSKVDAILEKIEIQALMFESLRSSLNDNLKVYFVVSLNNYFYLFAVQVAKLTEANGRINDKLEMILKEHTQRFEMILKEHLPTNDTTSKVDAILEKIEKQALMIKSLQSSVSNNFKPYCVASLNNYFYMSICIGGQVYRSQWKDR